jgi:hypothetical protein
MSMAACATTATSLRIFPTSSLTFTCIIHSF